MSCRLQALRRADEYRAGLEMRAHRAINFPRVRGRHHAQDYFSAGERLRKRSGYVHSSRQLESWKINFIDALRSQQINDVRTVRPDRQPMMPRRTRERDGQLRTPAPAANNRNFLHDSFRPISIRGSV